MSIVYNQFVYNKMISSRNKKTFPQDFLEANASELIENLEEMFPRYS